MLRAQKPYQVLRHNNQTECDVMLKNNSWRHCRWNWEDFKGQIHQQAPSALERSLWSQFTTNLIVWGVHRVELKRKSSKSFTPQHVLVLQSNKRRSSQGQHQRTTFQIVKLTFSTTSFSKKHQLSFVHTYNLGNITSIRPILTSKMEGGRVNTFGLKD